MAYSDMDSDDCKSNETLKIRSVEDDATGIKLFDRSNSFDATSNLDASRINRSASTLNAATAIDGSFIGFV